MKLILITIMATVISGTVLLMLSSQWLMIWIGFEMKMLGIIPILMK